MGNDEYRVPVDLAAIVAVEVMKTDPRANQVLPQIDPDLYEKFKDLGIESARVRGNLIAERAQRFCEAHELLDVERLRKRLDRYGGGLVAVAALLVILVVTLTMQGTVASLFTGDENKVSVGAMFALAAVPALFCLWSLVGLIILLIPRRRDERTISWNDSEQPMGRWWWLVGRFTLVGFFLESVGYARAAWGRRPDKQWEAVESTLKRQAQLTSTLLFLSSNFTLLAIKSSIFLSLCWFLTFNDSSYEWTSTLISEDDQVWCVKASGLGILPTPSDAAIAWAGGTLDLDSLVNEEPVVEPQVISPGDRVTGARVVFPPGSASEAAEGEELSKDSEKALTNRDERSNDTKSRPAEPFSDEADANDESLDAEEQSGSVQDPPPATEDNQTVAAGETSGKHLNFQEANEVRAGAAKSKSASDDGQAQSASSGTAAADSPPQQARSKRNSKVVQEKRYKREWGLYLISMLGFYTVLPRFVFSSVSGLLLLREWRRVRDRVGDQKVDRMIGCVMHSPFSASTETVVIPCEPKQLPSKSGEEIAKLPEGWQASQPAVETVAVVAPAVANELTSTQASEEPLPLAPANEPSGESPWLVLAFGMSRDEIDPIGASGIPAERIAGRESVESAGERKLFVQRYRPAGKRHNVLLCVPATSVPDRAFNNFLDKVRDCDTFRGNRVALGIMKAGEYLQWVGGDTELCNNRIALWRNEGVKRGVARDRVLTVSWDSPLEVAAVCSLIAGNSEPHSAKDATVARANKQNAALDELSQGISQAFVDGREMSHNSWLNLTQTLMQSIKDVYQKEQSSLLASLDFSKRITDVKARLGATSTTIDLIPKDLKEWWLVVEGYTKNLSPRWMAVGGLVAAGLAPAVAASGGLLATAAMLPFIPYFAAGGAVTAQLLKHKLNAKHQAKETALAAPTSSGVEGLDLEHCLRTCVVLIVLLEHAGNSHEVIQTAMSSQIGGLGDDPIHSLDDAQKLISRCRQSLTVIHPRFA